MLKIDFICLFGKCAKNQKHMKHIEFLKKCQSNCTLLHTHPPPSPNIPERNYRRANLLHKCNFARTSDNSSGGLRGGNGRSIPLQNNLKEELRREGKYGHQNTLTDRYYCKTIASGGTIYISRNRQLQS
jgi:hypothetical protein